MSFPKPLFNLKPNVKDLIKEVFCLQIILNLQIYIHFPEATTTFAPNSSDYCN